MSNDGRELNTVGERLYQLLDRIANAIEEQNRQNAEWIVMQTRWHMQDDIGKRLIAIHERNAKREEEWIEEQRRMLAEHLDKQIIMYAENLKKEGGSDTTLASDPQHQ